jgi:hypothetical protein
VGLFAEPAESRGDAELRQKFGKNGEIGVAGEQFLTKALANAGLDQYQSFSSLSLPDPHKLSIDIDKLLVNGNGRGGAMVVAIDAKKWSSHYRYWNLVPGTSLLPMKGFSPLLKEFDGHREWRLSKSMQIAAKQLREYLPNATVTPLAIFLPTQGSHNGNYRVPPSVRWFSFPGGVKAYLPGPGANAIYRILGDEVRPVPEPIIQKLKALERH